LSFSPGGKVLATADTDGAARLWDVASRWQIGAPIRIGGGVQVLDVAFGPGGKVLATADSDGTVRLWRVSGHRQIGKPFKVSSVRVLRVAFSPDGKVLATAGIGGQARLWDVATRRQVGAAMTAGGGVFTVTFSPSGKILATVDSQLRARLWNVATQRQIGAPIGGQPPFGAAVLGLAFSPDGKILATAGNENGQVRLWSVATHRQLGHYLSAGAAATASSSSAHDQEPRASRGYAGLCGPQRRSSSRWRAAGAPRRPPRRHRRELAPIRGMPQPSGGLRPEVASVPAGPPIPAVRPNADRTQLHNLRFSVATV